MKIDVVVDVRIDDDSVRIGGDSVKIDDEEMVIVSFVEWFVSSHEEIPSHALFSTSRFQLSVSV